MGEDVQLEGATASKMEVCLACWENSGEASVAEVE